MIWVSLLIVVAVVEAIALSDSMWKEGDDAIYIKKNTQSDIYTLTLSFFLI